MTHEEKCQAMREAYKDHRVDILREVRDKALKAYEEANYTYIEARDAFHKSYREIWK